MTKKKFLNRRRLLFIDDVVMAFGVAAVLTVVGSTLDLWLYPALKAESAIASNLITALVASGFFFSLRERRRLAERSLYQRIRMLNEVNDHIRNALQITMSPDGDSKRDAINRLALALKSSARNYVEDEDEKESAA